MSWEHARPRQTHIRQGPGKDSRTEGGCACSCAIASFVTKCLARLEVRARRRHHPASRNYPAVGIRQLASLVRCLGLLVGTTLLRVTYGSWRPYTAGHGRAAGHRLQRAAGLYRHVPQEGPDKTGAWRLTPPSTAQVHNCFLVPVSPLPCSACLHWVPLPLHSALPCGPSALTHHSA